jgi:hypothetical protein
VLGYAGTNTFFVQSPFLAGTVVAPNADVVISSLGANAFTGQLFAESYEVQPNATLTCDPVGSGLQVGSSSSILSVRAGDIGEFGGDGVAMPKLAGSTGMGGCSVAPSHPTGFGRADLAFVVCAGAFAFGGVRRCRRRAARTERKQRRVG